MASEAAGILSFGVQMHTLYELRALNKKKVKSLLDAVEMICEFLQRHYSLVVAEFPGHLQRLEVHVRAASDWCTSYVRSHAIFKTFNACIHGQTSDQLRTAMMACYQIMS